MWKILKTDIAAVRLGAAIIYREYRAQSIFCKQLTKCKRYIFGLLSFTTICLILYSSTLNGYHNRKLWRSGRVLNDSDLLPLPQLLDQIDYKYRIQNYADIIIRVTDSPDLIPVNESIFIKEFIKDILPATHISLPKFFGHAANERQRAVKDVFKHSWSAYKRYAWGFDYLKPRSKRGVNLYGIGLTIIDSIDTMYFMNLWDEYAQAQQWITTTLDFSKLLDVNIFELTVRALGGLLSAYNLSGNIAFLQKSIELGNYLLGQFLSRTGLPYLNYNDFDDNILLSELGAIQLEFRELSRLTGIPIYEDLAQLVNERLRNLQKVNDLTPISINVVTGKLNDYKKITLGSGGYSYYEYLLKQWLQTGRTHNDDFSMDYQFAIEGVLNLLVQHTKYRNYTFIGAYVLGDGFVPCMEHVTCFLPGILYLGVHYGMPSKHLTLAKELLETCRHTYMMQATNLAPNAYCFPVSPDNVNGEIVVQDARNHLRSEFIASLYYFYALTGESFYQDIGWEIFKAFCRYTKLSNGYTEYANTMNIFKTQLDDIMDSFWTAKTLKYFYLLFGDNRLIDLNEWLLTTEAHLLPIPRQKQHIHIRILKKPINKKRKNIH